MMGLYNLKGMKITRGHTTCMTNYETFAAPILAPLLKLRNHDLISFNFIVLNNSLVSFRKNGRDMHGRDSVSILASNLV